MSVSPLDLAREWIRKAEGDLAAGRTLVASRDQNQPFIAGFHAHQTVEKAIKAILVAHQIDFPPTHDLHLLQDLLPPGAAPKAISGLEDLNRFATVERYPRPGPQPAWAEVETLVELAARALRAAAGDVGVDLATDDDLH